jgi:hypothetical protein
VVNNSVNRKNNEEKLQTHQSQVKQPLTNVNQEMYSCQDKNANVDERNAVGARKSCQTKTTGHKIRREASFHHLGRPTVAVKPWRLAQVAQVAEQDQTPVATVLIRWAEMIVEAVVAAVRVQRLMMMSRLKATQRMQRNVSWTDADLNCDYCCDWRCDWQHDCHYGCDRDSMMDGFGMTQMMRMMTMHWKLQHQNLIQPFGVASTEPNTVLDAVIPRKSESAHRKTDRAVTVQSRLRPS